MNSGGFNLVIENLLISTLHPTPYRQQSGQFQSRNRESSYFNVTRHIVSNGNRA